MKRPIGIMCCLFLLVLCSVTASAQTELPLLSEAATKLTSASGEFAYTPEGAVHISAHTEEGAAVAVNIDQTVNIHTVKYLQLCVETTAPFNIALKMSGASYDIFPQTTGPSWYEVFQPSPPGDGEGVAAGRYAVSLDVRNYVEYNDLEVAADGFVTLKTVYLSVRGVGDMLVHHLVLSDVADFTAANGQVGAAATTMVPITTDTTGSVTPTHATYVTNYTAGAANDAAYDNDSLPTEVITVLVVAVVLIGGTVLLTVLKKRKPQETNTEE